MSGGYLQLYNQEAVTFITNRWDELICYDW